LSDSAVAFFRNLNLGQRRSRSPTRPELLHAFERAGATDALNFQVNGTIVFQTDQDAQALAEEAVRLLTPVCGYDDAVIVRPVPWILDLDLADIGANAEVSLFDGPDQFPEPLPWVAGTGVTVVRADHLHAVCANDVERTSGGTWTLERLLGMPVTSRGVSTMLRLQARLRTMD
jgi:hypothetical protein